MKTSPRLSTLFAAVAVTLVTGAVEATNCTDDEYDTILATEVKYGKSLGAACVPDMCSADCVAALTQITDLLPECDVMTGGVSHEMFADGVSGCTSNASDDSSSSSSNHTCSPAEKVVTLTVYSAYDEEFVCACLQDSCSAGCLEVGQDMVAKFPDCYYPEYGFNFVDSINARFATCEDIGGSTIDDSVGSEGSSSSTVEVAGSSSSGAAVALIPTIATLGLAAAANMLL